jgi:DNA polymerase-3 subunit gamma/tau
MARLDRLERRMTISGGDPSPAPIAATEPASVKPAPPVVEPTVIEPVRPAEPVQPAQAGSPPPPETSPVPAPPATTAAGSTLTLVDVRRLWPDIVEATKQRRRLTWIYLTQQAQVVAVDDATLTLGFVNVGARESFDSGGSAEIVRQAAIDVVGHDWRVETIVDPGADPEAAPPVRPAPTGSALPSEPTGPPAERPSASARQAIASTRGAAGPDDRSDAPAEPDGGARSDDTDAETSGLDSTQLLEEALGAQVIEEIRHQ